MAYLETHPTTRVIYYKRKDQSYLITILSGRSRFILGATLNRRSAVLNQGKRQACILVTCEPVPRAHVRACNGRC